MIIITEIVPMALSLWACETILNNKLNDILSIFHRINLNHSVRFISLFSS
jgi:hypothetical protein